MARSNIFRIPRRRKYYTDSERLDYKILQTTQSIEHLKKVRRSESHTASLKTKNKSYQDLKRLSTSLQELTKLKNLAIRSKNKKKPKALFINPGFIKKRRSSSIVGTNSSLKESYAKEKFEKSVKNYPKGGKTRRDPFATQKDPTEDFDVNDLYKYR